MLGSKIPTFWVKRKGSSAAVKRVVRGNGKQERPLYAHSLIHSFIHSFIQTKTKQRQADDSCVTHECLCVYASASAERQAKCGSELSLGRIELLCVARREGDAHWPVDGLAGRLHVGPAALDLLEAYEDILLGVSVPDHHGHLRGARGTNHESGSGFDHDRRSATTRVGVSRTRHEAHSG